MFEDVAPGVAAEFVAAGPGFALTAAVLLPGVAGVVVAIAVELDGQPMLGPPAVDTVRAGRAVGARQHPPQLAQMLEEPRFQLAERDMHVAAHDGAELRRARAVRPAREDGVDHRRCRAVTHAHLVARARELAGREHGSQIDERARHGGDGDPAPGGHVFPRRSARPYCRRHDAWSGWLPRGPGQSPLKGLLAARPDAEAQGRHAAHRLASGRGGERVRYNGRLIHSATDLINFLECPHLTHLDLEVVRGPARHRAHPHRLRATSSRARATSTRPRTSSRCGPPAARSSRSPPRRGSTGSLAAARDRTLAAMRDGAEIIYQGALFDGERWRGYADFLERVDRPVGPRRLELRGRRHQARPPGQAVLPAPALLLHASCSTQHPGTRRPSGCTSCSAPASARASALGRVPRLLPPRARALLRASSPTASTAPTRTRSSTAACAAGRSTATRGARPTTT